MRVVYGCATVGVNNYYTPSGKSPVEKIRNSVLQKVGPIFVKSNYSL